jgi:catechol 2,3-dioxygenase-like lactoylglutathione lyase family enzyme
MNEEEKDMLGSIRPKLGALINASIPVRNLKEAKRFYTEVLGGDIVLKTNPRFAEVRLGRAIFGVSEQEGGWTDANAEFPHYAFTMAGEHFHPFIEHLKACGVQTHQPWTRHGIEALMYFRDPSGNLLELFCERGVKDADKLPRLVKAGGNLLVDFAALKYDWKG